MAEFTDSLVKHLKELNAKERDHLMRFAYLGATHAYEDARNPCDKERCDKERCDSTRWLSKDMICALKPQLVGTDLERSSTHCVFAGMDYHLDWLYAALFFTCKATGPNAESETYPLDDKPRSKDDPKQPMVGEQDDSLRPIIGIQEDVDLLVVFADKQDHVVMLCIEAKGVASFDKVQLARKLVRLDRILVASGAKDRLTCKLVLIGPKDKGIKAESCLTHANSLPENARLQGMRNHLKNMRTDIGCDDAKKVFVELTGFPKTLKKVTRVRASSCVTDDKGRHSFTDWTIRTR